MSDKYGTVNNPNAVRTTTKKEEKTHFLGRAREKVRPLARRSKCLRRVGGDEPVWSPSLIIDSFFQLFAVLANFGEN